MEKKSLQEVREFGADKLTKRILFQKGESVSFVLNFAPGQTLPPHKHPGTAVFLLVVEGAGTMTVDGVQTEVALNDAICVEGEEMFAFENTGTEPARLYVVLSKIPDARYAQNV